MQPFPYIQIIKKSYELVWSNKWLWWFGLFVGGVAGSNFSIFDQGRRFFGQPEEGPRPQDVLAAAVSWIQANQTIFFALAGLALAVFFAALVIQAWARAAVVWSGDNLAQRRSGVTVGLGSALKHGRRHIWPIAVLQLALAGLLTVLLAVFAAPVAYLFAGGAAAQAILLALLGAAVFVPALVMVGFIHLFGPIFIVVFSQRAGSAVNLSFQLIRKKWRECIVLAALLIGIQMVFLLVLAFTLLVLAALAALLVALLVFLGFGAAVPALAAAAILAGLIYVIVFRAAFAVFHNFVWVLAVKALMGAVTSDEEAEELATQPAI